MSKKNTAKDTGPFTLVTQDIQRAITLLGENQNVHYISVNKIAETVMQLWQNGNVLDIRIKWTATQEIKELAREILRKYDPCNAESEAYQGTLEFKELQPWYPIPGGTGKWWRLEQLSQEDIQWNVNRLRQHAKACIHHADALEEYSSRKN